MTGKAGGALDRGGGPLAPPWPASPAAPAPPAVLTIPGLCCSGPDHWQTLWEQQRADCRRIELPDWDDPCPIAWSRGIADVLDGAARGIVLAAHSLGCHALIRWATRPENRATERIAAALLVAPPDVEQAGVDPRIARFAPLAPATLPFPARLVASNNDPYATMAASRRMAEAWGADLVDLGACGHINAQSGLGCWPEGQRLAGLTEQGTTHPGG